MGRRSLLVDGVGSERDIEACKAIQPRLPLPYGFAATPPAHSECLVATRYVKLKST
jgi:hypothetical protein